MADPTPPDFLLGYTPYTIQTHPLAPPSDEARRRWMATRARRRLMEGAWALDLWRWAQTERDFALLEAMGHLDVSECLYRSVVEQLAVLYEQEPEVSAPEATAPEVLEQLDRLFAEHTALDEFVRAYGEAAVLLDVVPGDGGGVLRDVAPVVLRPDEFDALPLTPRSRRVGAFRAAVQRPVPFLTGCPTWGWDVWDLRGLVPEYHFVLNGGQPVAGYCLVGDGDLATGAGPYPWRFADGRAFIPAVLYHAERGSGMFDPFRWPELARATLENAMAWSDWREGLTNASFAQRVLWDAEVVGDVGSGEGATGSMHVLTSETTMLHLRSTDAVHAGRAETMQATVDPLKLGQAIALRHRLRATTIGLHPSEVETSTSPESGVALTIRREGQRRAQRRAAPLMRQGDLELLRKWVAVRAGLGLPTGPEEGWRINYPAWPETADEANNRRADEAHDLDRKLADRADILMRRDRISREEAEARVARIDGATAAVEAEGAVPPEEKALGVEEESTRAAPPLEPPPPRPELPEYPYAGQMRWGPLTVLVETAAGEERSGTDPDGRPWSVTMPWHYGEVEGTLGLDGDPVDVMVGPDPEGAEAAYVLHLRRPGLEGADEDKVYVGFASEEDALAAFRAAYTRHDILSGFTRWRADDMIAWLQDEGNHGLRLDAPPRSGLPARAPDLEVAETEPPEEPDEETTDEASVATEIADGASEAEPSEASGEDVLDEPSETR